MFQNDVLTSHRECGGVGNKAILLQFFGKAGLPIAFTFFLAHFNTSLRCSNHWKIIIRCSITIYTRVLGDLLRVYLILMGSHSKNEYNCSQHTQFQEQKASDGAKVVVQSILGYDSFRNFLLKKLFL